MSTSTEQINDLIAGNTALKTFFEGERDALIAAKADLPGLIARSGVYVDEVNGLPGNDGSLAQPYDSIDTALAACRDGQLFEALLLSDCTWSTKVSKRGVHFNVLGWDAGGSTTMTRAVTMANAATNNANDVPGIHILGYGSVQFQSVALTLSNNDPGITGAQFRCVGFGRIGFVGASIIGTNGTCALLDPYSGGFSLGGAALTATDMAGRWVKGVASGVALNIDHSRGIVGPGFTN